MDSERDHLDELLSQARPRPPDGLGSRVNVRARLERRAPLLAAAFGGMILALLAIASLSMLLAQHAQTNGLPALVAYVGQDWALVQSDPGWFAAAAADAVYWPGVAGIAFGVLVFLWLTGVLMRAAGEIVAPEDRR